MKGIFLELLSSILFSAIFCLDKGDHHSVCDMLASDGIILWGCCLTAYKHVPFMRLTANSAPYSVLDCEASLARWLYSDAQRRWQAGLVQMR